MKKAAATAGMKPPAGGVTVRMYRQGLGDCFLLAFDRGAKRPFYMLIDCGVILGTKNPSAIMTEVAEHIHQTTGGALDLLVLTHEHWDHLSGFVDARDVFKKFQGRIGAFWLGWTEQPGNEAAQQLQSERQRRARALQAFASQYRSAGLSTDASSRVEALLAFHGLAAAGSQNSTADALKHAREVFGREPEYLRPGGKPKELDALPGVRFFVLGPPEDPKDIRKVRPSRSTPETYHRFDRLTFNAESAFFAAALDTNDTHATGLFEDPSAMEAQSRPFPPADCIPEARVLKARRRRKSKQARDDVAYLGSLYRAQAWRKIDGDWLNTAAVLALQLDNQTNNTSVALAIQLRKGKVLLFPGDAQVGSWRSWQKLTWTVPNGPGTRKVKVDELLSDTIFYKVSHHGSHNATLADLGLRKMTSEDLVAMIPVDERVARRTKKWDMPFGPLLRDLRKRACQRVVQIAPLGRATALPARAPEGVPAAAWKRFRDSLREDRLFWEYDISV